MKTKKLLILAAAAMICGSAMALDHGSISVKDAQMYAQIDDNSGANVLDPIPGLTVDYKLVTIGATTWAWTQLNGASLHGEFDWESQLRWWVPGKDAKTIGGRIAGTSQSYAKIEGLPAEAPVQFSIFQYPDYPGNWTFYETAKRTYNYTTLNSYEPLDQEAPTLAEPVIAGQTGATLTLTLSAEDDSEDFFYYISDEANGIVEVSFLNTVSLPLSTGIDYNFSIQAIDFTGNVSATKTISVQGKEFECNNLLQNAALTLNKVELLPNWAGSANYTASVANNVVSLHLGDGTYGQWQAQVWLNVVEPVALTPGEKYSLLVDMETTKGTPFYVKFADDDDSSVFMDIPLQPVTSGEVKTLAVYDLTCPAALTQVSKIIFDFGNNPSDVDITLSNISICSPDTQSSVKNASVETMSISQQNNIIYIHSENQLASAALYSVSGQNVPVKVVENQINTGNLSSGIYVLSVVDALDNTQEFKIIVK